MAFRLLTTAQTRRVTRGFQGVIGLILLVGVGLGNASVVVNGLVALSVTFLPALLERDLGVSLSPVLVAWIALAAALHSLGMLGLYRDVWWYDHVTHVLSAMLVAGVGYATARAIDVHSDAVYFPPQFLAVYVLLFTLAFGVLWEVLEFVAREIARATGNEPLLVQYGLEDTMADLLFDAVGAVVFAVAGRPVWEGTVPGLVDFLERRSGEQSD